MAMGIFRILHMFFIYLHKFVFLLVMHYFQARSDLKMEFFHLISFLLSHCMNKWRVPNDQVSSSIPNMSSFVVHFQFKISIFFNYFPLVLHISYFQLVLVQYFLLVLHIQFFLLYNDSKLRLCSLLYV